MGTLSDLWKDAKEHVGKPLKSIHSFVKATPKATSDFWKSDDTQKYLKYGWDDPKQRYEKTEAKVRRTGRQLEALKTPLSYTKGYFGNSYESVLPGMSRKRKLTSAERHQKDQAMIAAGLIATGGSALYFGGAGAGGTTAATGGEAGTIGPGGEVITSASGSGTAPAASTPWWTKLIPKSLPQGGGGTTETGESALDIIRKIAIARAMREQKAEANRRRREELLNDEGGQYGV